MALPRRRRLWNILIVLGVALLVVGCAGYELLSGPSIAFDKASPPPAPDYSRPQAWLAFPGDNGLERSVPPGMTPVSEAGAPADVFFIHPTTYLKSDVWNAPYDAPDDQAVFNPAVNLGQASVFNGCCRIYAPHYRQATLYALGHSEPASALAYADVARAFRYFIAHESHGRPFILASHSQGTGHLVRLLQEEIIGTPLSKRLIAVYAIGGYVPSTFASLGLPACASETQTACILSWNTGQAGRSGVHDAVDKPRGFWWQGRVQDHDVPPAICINPLTWTAAGSASTGANAGSLAFPKAPFPKAAAALPPLIPASTGAVCNKGVLEVDIPSSAPSGFHDALSFVMGSYHNSDYGIFYAAVRRNAALRVSSWLAANPSAH